MIHYSGWVYWEFGGIFTTICDLNILEYPFDTHTCNVDIGIWRYTTDMVDLVPKQIHSDTFEENPLWELKETSYSYERSFGRFAKCHFELTFSRKPLYFVMNILVPTIMVTFIALGVFWLPSDCGEKASLGITVLLAFSVFQIIITEKTPMNSDQTPKISRFHSFGFEALD